MTGLPLVIVNVTLARPILGRSWLGVLCMNWRQNMLNNSTRVIGEKFRYVTDSRQLRIHELLTTYKHVYSRDITKPIIGHKVHVSLKQSAIPIFRKCYTVPFQLRECVQKELENLQGVLKPIEYTD